MWPIRCTTFGTIVETVRLDELPPQILSIFKALGINVAALSTVVLMFSMYRQKIVGLIGQSGQIKVGVAFGMFALIAMMLPVTIAEGVIIDARVILVSIAAVISGPLAGAVSFSFPAIYRLYLGGVGVYPGIGAIATGALAGSIFHHLNLSKKIDEGILSLTALGIVVSILSLTWTLLLPAPVASKALELYLLPVLSPWHTVFRFHPTKRDQKI